MPFMNKEYYLRSSRLPYLNTSWFASLWKKMLATELGIIAAGERTARRIAVAC